MSLDQDIAKGIYIAGKQKHDDELHYPAWKVLGWLMLTLKNDHVHGAIWVQYLVFIPIWYVKYLFIKAIVNVLELWMMKMQVPKLIHLWYVVKEMLGFMKLDVWLPLWIRDIQS